MWTVRRVSVVLALSATTFAASGVAAAVVAVADAVPDAEVVPDADVVCDVSDLVPHPDKTSAESDATANAATAHDGFGRRRTRRVEVCACDIRSFMVSLC